MPREITRCERKIFALIEEPKTIVVMCRGSVSTDTLAVAEWLKQTKQSDVEYEPLKTIEAIRLIKDRKIPRGCFPIYGLSDGGKKADQLCSQGFQHSVKNPGAIPSDDGIFILFKEKAK